MIHKITRINRTDRTSKKGRPYVSMGLQINSYGDRWLNGFGGQENAHWQIGTELKDGTDIRIFEEEWEGKMQLKFKTPKNTDVLAERVEKIAQYLTQKTGIDF